MTARWRYGIGNEFAALATGGEKQAEGDEIFGEEKQADNVQRLRVHHAGRGGQVRAQTEVIKR